MKAQQPQRGRPAVAVPIPDVNDPPEAIDAFVDGHRAYRDGVGLSIAPDSDDPHDARLWWVRGWLYGLSEQ